MEIKDLEKEQQIIKKVSDFLHVECNFKSSTLEENIKELCVARICKSIGIRCEYNYKSTLFEFCSCITGQAVADILGIKIDIVPPKIKCCRYDGINIYQEVKKFIETEEVDEAFCDAFKLLDKYKYLA